MVNAIMLMNILVPNALEVEVIGDFNNWDGRNHKMNKVDDRGIYELYISEVSADYCVYRYNILTRKQGKSINDFPCLHHLYDLLIFISQSH